MQVQSHFLLALQVSLPQLCKAFCSGVDPFISSFVATVSPFYFTFYAAHGSLDAYTQPSRPPEPVKEKEPPPDLCVLVHERTVRRAVLLSALWSTRVQTLFFCGLSFTYFLCNARSRTPLAFLVFLVFSASACTLA